MLIVEDKFNFLFLTYFPNYLSFCYAYNVLVSIFADIADGSAFCIAIIKPLLLQIMISTCNSKHDWTPVKYMNVFHLKRSILDLLDITGLFYQKQKCKLVETFMLMWRQKINFIPLNFLEILQRYANFLFWVLWACLAMPAKMIPLTFKKLMFFYMPNIDFIIHFFLDTTF